MAIQRVAILGANGLLGHPIQLALEQRGLHVIALTRADFDLGETSIAPLMKILEREHVDAVVNCAAVIRPFIETHPIEQVIRINSIFPIELARLCETRGMPCLHFSTDCVFDGLKGPYVESDEMTATDIYGLTKAAGDAARCMVLRTTLLGEERGRAHALLEWIKSRRGHAIGGFTNRPWNGVTAPMMARVVADILTQGLYEVGIVHIHSPNTISRLELFQLVNEVFDLHMKITPEEAPGMCDRTQKSEKRFAQLLVTSSVQEQIHDLAQLQHRQVDSRCPIQGLSL